MTVKYVNEMIAVGHPCPEPNFRQRESNRQAVLDRQPESKNNDRQPEQNPFVLLDQQIAAHRRHDKKETWLGHGLSFASRVGGEADQSLKNMEALREKLRGQQEVGANKAQRDIEKQIEQLVKADRQILAWKDGLSHYGGSFLKTALLFMPGRMALAGTVALHGLDQARMGDPFKLQATDLVLGGLKGYAVRTVMQKVGETSLGVATKGATIGLTNTAAEIALTRATYTNTATGEFSAAGGLGNIAKNAFDPSARLLDASTFVIAHGLVKTGNVWSNGALERSPLLSTMANGGSFGFTSGSASELMRQKEAGENFDLSRILVSGVTQAAIDTFAAAPGGIMARNGQIKSQKLSVEQYYGRQLTLLEGSKILANLPGSAVTRQASVLEATGNQASAVKPTIDEITAEKPETKARSTENGSKTQRRFELAANQLEEANQNHNGKYDWDAPETLALPQRPEEPLADMVNRIGKHETVIEEHAVPVADDTLVFKNYEDYCNRGLTLEQRPVRLYTVAGTDIQIAVAEKYAASLERARDLQLEAERNKDPEAWAKLAKEPMFNTLRPEHIPALLAELPDGGALFVKRINLHYGEESILNRWLRQTYDSEFKAAGQANKFDSSIELFDGKRDRIDRAREIFVHEWAHLVKFSMPEVSRLFNLACVLEEHGFYQRRYALRNTDENWAVHFEKALRADSHELLELEMEAPIRLAIFGRTLRKVLDATPMEKRGVYHDRFELRAKFIEEEVLPEAIDQLIELQKHPNARYRKTAMKLLGALGGERELEYLPFLAKNQDPKTAVFTFEAASQIGQRHPESWLRHLVFMSGVESAVRNLATDQLANMLVKEKLPAETRCRLDSDARRIVYLKAANQTLAQGNMRRTIELVDAAVQTVESKGFYGYDDYEQTLMGVNRICHSMTSRFRAAQAEQLIDRLMVRKVLGDDHPLTGLLLSTKAYLQETQGHKDQAIATYHKALEIAKVNSGPYCPQAQQIRKSLSWLLLENGQVAGAGSLYDFLLEKCPKPKHDARRLAELKDVAGTFTAWSQHSYAEKLLRQADKMLEGQQTEERADVLNNLGTCLWQQRRPFEAAQVFRSELALREQLSPANTEVAHTLKIAHLQSMIKLAYEQAASPQ